MKIGIVHLSDLHFKADKNLLSHRALTIASAAGNVDPTCSAYLLLISGDIAYSGKSAEYEQAFKFFDELKQQLETLKAKPVVYLSTIPGNHDCDFALAGDTRAMAVEYLRDRLPDFNPVGDLAQSCLAVQAEYFAFQARLLEDTPKVGAAQFAWRTALDVCGEKVVVNCLNSAWLSKLHEEQGELLFPCEAALSGWDESLPCLVAITMIHHPFNWFPAENARELQQRIESFSDVILTGHEHHSNAFTRELFSGDRTYYIEGGVLQDSTDVLPSGFNVIIIDTEQQAMKPFQLRWRSGMYNESSGNNWTPLARKTLTSVDRFPITDNFNNHLKDVGTGFTHASRRKIYLRDLFVYPDLDRRLSGSKTDRTSTSKANGRHSADDILEDLAGGESVIILGDSLSGKTTLSKIFFEDLRNKGLAPLLASGNHLKDVSLDKVPEVLQTIFEVQYRSTPWQAYKQLDFKRKVLILDDFHTLQPGSRRPHLLKALSAWFRSILVFCDEIAGLEMMSQDEFNCLKPLSMYSIRELGNVLRGKLVERWVLLDPSQYTSDEERDQNVNALERLISTVLGRNLLPSYPVVILTLLQAWEASKHENFASGSYAYLYESLIIRAISVLQLQPTEIDIVKTYLSLVANRMREHDADSLSRSEYAQLENEYFNRYLVLVPQGIVERLINARVLSHMSGRIGFQYRYYYFFFAAMYFRDRMGTESERSHTRVILMQMAESIHYTDDAEILLFYVYLTKDVETIRGILDCARRVFDDHQPCDLQDDIRSVNDLYISTSTPLILDNSDHRKNREEYKRALDEQNAEAGEELEPLGPTTGEERSRKSYDRALNLVVRMNVATKMLQILGQVLRTSPGSLEAGLKQDVAQETYLLGLRTLNAVLSVTVQNIEPLRLFLAELIKENRALKKQSILPSEIGRLADESVIEFTEGVVLGMIRRISQAVGTEHLEEIYRGVLSSSPDSVPFRLIDLSIKVDLFKPLLPKKVRRFKEDLLKNPIAVGVLRHLVFLYLYLNPVKYAERQQLTALMNIGISHNKLIENASKKRR